MAIAAGRAHGQAADAEVLFDLGDKLMAEGKLGDACDAFEASNRMDPRAGTLIRLGDCREANHQLASAWTAYKDALARVKDPRKREIAAQHVADLEPQLSQITLLVPDASRVDNLAITRNGVTIDPMLWNRTIPIDGGTFTFAARAPEYDTWVEEVVVPETGGKIEVHVPGLVKTVRAAPPLPAPRTRHVARSPLLRNVAFGVAGAGAAGSIVAGVLARTKLTAALAICPDRRCPDPASTARADTLLRQSRLRGNIATASGALGGVALVAAAILWWRGRRDTISIAPVVGATQVGVAIGGAL
jgi:hypothetical protein